MQIRLMAGTVSLTALMCALAQPAGAQPQAPPAPEAGSQIDEIVVTANRRAERAQDVPISMTVIGGEEAAAHFRTSADVERMTPNVQLTNDIGFGMPRTSIRGISQNDFNAAATTSNMIYIDDVALDAPMSQGVPVWDLERVEVLRGPQGTLFGRNATGGAVRFIVATPGTEPDGYLELGAGAWEQRTVRAAYGGPIGDTVGVRLAYVREEFGGDIQNPILQRRVGDQEYSGVRGVITWSPTDELTATLRAQYFTGDVSGMIWKSTPGYTEAPLGFTPSANGFTTIEQIQRSKGYQALGPGSDFSISESDVRNNEHMEHTPISLNVDYDLGFATLTSVTGFLDVKQTFIADNDGSPAIFLTEYTHNYNSQYSQEFRLTSNQEGPLKWIAGGYYMKGKVKSRNAFDITDYLGNVSYEDGGVPDAETLVNIRAIRSGVETYAGFLHATYDVTPDLTLTAAARLTHEKKTADYQFASFVSYATATPRTPAQIPDFMRAVDNNDFTIVWLEPADPLSASKAYDNLSWKLGVDYRLAPGTMLYALVSKGFKGGAFPPTANFPSEVLDAQGQVNGVKPETIIDYEAGVKSDVIPGRLRVNGSVFYYDYKNYQTNQIVPELSIQVLSNLPKAELYGVELEVTAVPAPNLTLNVGAGLLHSEITKAGDPALVGNKLPYSQDFNWNALARYDIHTGFGTISPEISAKYVGRYYATKENELEVGGYTLVDARVAFESKDGDWYGSLWGTNLADRSERTVVNDPSEFFGGDITFVTPHRRYGITVGRRF